MKNWDPNYLPYQPSPKIPSKCRTISPPLVLFWGFSTVILIGALLLMMPFSYVTPISWNQAIFTAASAVTVTGLVVVDTGSQFTIWGQTIIALLIQIGGLGFVTFAILAATSVGAKFNIGRMKVAQEALGQTSLEQITNIAKFVIIIALVIEFIGFILLTLLFLQQQSIGDATYNAFFYTISAFNNAGFALSADSLTAFRGDAGINLVITSLFIIGGLGFIVLIDIKDNRRWFKFTVNTKVVLLATLIINALAFLLFWLIEKNNSATLATLPLSEQLWASWFQAVTPRTAGFNTLPIEQLENSSTLLVILLMFIGGGSLSTASGLKLGTFVILLLATYHFLRQRAQVTIFSRSVKNKAIFTALSLFVVYIFLIFAGIFLLTLTEDAPFLDIVFETVSAIGTVGLSRGLTGTLSIYGQFIIIFLMLVGRVGPLTFMYLLATSKRKHVTYASTSIKVG